MPSEQELSYAHFGCFCHTNSLSHVTYFKYFAQKQEGICPLWMSSEGRLEGMSGRLIPISLQIDILTVACNWQDTVSGLVDFEFHKSNITNELRLFFATRIIGTSVVFFPFFPRLTLPLIFNRDISIYFRRDDVVKWKWLQDISDKSLAVFPHLLHQLLLMYLFVYYSSWKNRSEVGPIKLCKLIFVVQLFNQIKKPSKPWNRNLLAETTFDILYSIQI